MNFIDKIIKRVIRVDSYSRNQENDDEVDDDKPEFYGPRRKAKENERWVHFKTKEGKEAFYLKKISPSMQEIEEIVTSPFLDAIDKELKLTEMGASPTKIRQAKLNAAIRKRRY